MNHYTEIHPDGTRAYQFVADTAYVRESGTKGEHKAAEYILKEAEKIAAQPGKETYIQTPRMELFQCPDFQEKRAELTICQPYEKSYRVRAYLNGACTPAEGITAPFLFVGKGDDISLSKAKGAVVLVCDPVREDMINKIKDAGAVGFVTVCGTPLDQGEDRTPIQYRRKACDLPGAAIHYLDAVEIVETLNRLGGENGIGLADLVENRLVGMKSRGVYETPGGTILYRAHQVLETICLDRDTQHYKELVASRFAELVYFGQWFTPLREALSAFVDKTQETVTGSVTLKLYKGNLINAGVTSPYTLYSEEIATFDEDHVYDQSDAEGFINLFGLPVKVKAMMEQKRREQ